MNEIAIAVIIFVMFVIILAAHRRMLEAEDEEDGIRIIEGNFKNVSNMGIKPTHRVRPYF